MKVKELTEQLLKLNPEYDVVFAEEGTEYNFCHGYTIEYKCDVLGVKESISGVYNEDRSKIYFRPCALLNWERSKRFADRMKE